MTQRLHRYFCLELFFCPLRLEFGGGKQQAAAAPPAPAPPPAPPAPAKATTEARTLLSQVLPKRGMYSTILTRQDPFARYGGGTAFPSAGAAAPANPLKTLLGTGIY